MQITVTTLSDAIFTLEVSDDMELENFKALCEFETGISAQQIAIIWNGIPLHDSHRKLKDYGVKDGDVLLLQHIQGAVGQPSTGQHQAPGVYSRPAPPGAPFIDFSQVEIPGAAGPPVPVMGGHAPVQPPEDPATLREMLLSSPHDMALLKERNPALAEALNSGSLERFTEVLRRQQEERAERERERIRLLTANPFDPDVQRQIAEEIRLKNVEHNMETAMEYSPESFGQVVMLYVDCNVNGHPVKAFVDSGAQMTIMSQACAERCNIMRLVDQRWAGIAKGVGTQKIIGRVHLCQIQIGPVFLQSSFSILEDQPMDMLLGLDMLKRHQCIIDLKSGLLIIGTTGTQTPFLTEADLPHHARQSVAMDDDQQLAEALAKSAESEMGSRPGTSRDTGHHSSPSQAQPSPRQPAFPEHDIARLCAFGFPRNLVVQELTAAAGDVDQALAALFAKSFQMP